MERCLKLVQSKVESELHSFIQAGKQEYHNHPPVRFHVSNCPYCNKYGNVFAKTDM